MYTRINRKLSMTFSTSRYFIFISILVLLMHNHSKSTSGSSCENNPPVNVTRLPYSCDNAFNFSGDNNYGAIKLWIDFFNCSSIPEDLFRNYSNALQTLVLSASLISNPEIESLPLGLLRNLGNVTELQLRGFDNVRRIDKHALISLANIRCLYFEGFGKYYMSYSETLSVLKDLSGTPLTSIVMKDVQSIRNKHRKLDLNVFAIPNVTLTRLAIDNSVVTSLVGQLSQIQPSLTSLSLSLDSKYDDMLGTIFDALFVMPNLRTLRLYGHTTKSVFNVNNESFMNFLKNVKYVNFYFDRSCHFNIKIVLSRSLREISINNIQTIEYADWTDPNDNKTLCFDESNQIVNLDLSNTSLGNLRLISGVLQLEILNVRNASILRFLPEHLKNFPRLKTLLISDNPDIGESIAMDIGANTFKYGHRLVVLDLAKCNLTRIPRREFGSLISLRYLNLSGNRIRVVDWVLQNCSRLMHLDLSYNEIEQLTNDFIIDQLDPFISSSVPVSSDNYNASNLVDFLPANSGDWQNTSSLMIDLSGNPLSCQCNASSFIRWIQSKKQRVFIGYEDYKCLLPNGTWAKIIRVDVLENECTVLKELENNTNCPCDYDKLQRLYAVRYSLAEYYCFYPDGRLINMKLLEPNSASKACLTSTGLPSFVVPVVVSASFVIIIIITVIFVVVYRRKRPLEFRQIIECLDPSRLTGTLMAILNDYNRVVNIEELTEGVSYHAFFAFCSDDRNELDHEVMSKLIAQGVKIVTEDEIEAGAYNAEILSEVTRRCRSIVLVLTPEFVQNDWLRKITNHALLGECALVPFVYRPLDLNENEFLYSNIINNYLPIYWTEQSEEREKALKDLSERLLNDTRTWVGQSIVTSVQESY